MQLCNYTNFPVIQLCKISNYALKLIIKFCNFEMHSMGRAYCNCLALVFMLIFVCFRGRDISDKRWNSYNDVL